MSPNIILTAIATKLNAKNKLIMLKATIAIPIRKAETILQTRFFIALSPSESQPAVMTVADLQFDTLPMKSQIHFCMSLLNNAKTKETFLNFVRKSSVFIEAIKTKKHVKLTRRCSETVHFSRIFSVAKRPNGKNPREMPGQIKKSGSIRTAQIDDRQFDVFLRIRGGNK